jgi:hypothetical protein
VELMLADEMLNELEKAARACQCTPRQFALDCVESVLASRRLPHVFVPTLTQGAQIGRGAGHEDENETDLVRHKILL